MKQKKSKYYNLLEHNAVLIAEGAKNFDRLTKQRPSMLRLLVRKTETTN
jgi:hypothetical protein